MKRSYGFFVVLSLEIDVGFTPGVVVHRFDLHPNVGDDCLHMQLE